jgi:hypothetical protein
MGFQCGIKNIIINLVYLVIIKKRYIMEENIKLFLSISWEKIEYYYDEE